VKFLYSPPLDQPEHALEEEEDPGAAEISVADGEHAPEDAERPCARSLPQPQNPPGCQNRMAVGWRKCQEISACDEGSGGGGGGGGGGATDPPAHRHTKT
jgi:hypothetical protein